MSAAAEGADGGRLTYAAYQERVGGHVALVTHDDPTDIAERRDRFGEESLECLQAFGQTRAEAHALVDYVHGRPVGVPGREMGGVMYTAAALANEAGIDLEACAEEELARLMAPAMVARIRAKRATRHGRGALPGRDPDAPATPARAFAEGAAAHAGGLDASACPFADPALVRAWKTGWQACGDHAS